MPAGAQLGARPFQRIAGWPFTVLLIVTFCGGGLAFAFNLVRALNTGNWHDVAVLIPLTFFFNLVGFGLVGVVVFGRKNFRAENERKNAHPDSPWLWRGDWTGGRLVCSVGRELLRHLFWVVLFGVLLIPAAILTVNEKQLFRSVFIFLMAGFLSWRFVPPAVSSMIRVSRGHLPSLLTLERVPCVPGKRLECTLEVPVPLCPDKGFSATLECRQNFSGVFGGRSECYWRKTEVGLPSRVEGGKTKLSFGFEIPADAKTTDAVRRIEWRITIHALLKPVNFLSCFEIPVFRIPKSVEAALDGNLPQE